jgi:rhodanese-related sulfurtransferase
MRLWIYASLFVGTLLCADYTRQPIDAKVVNSKIKIIDIRTPGEWKTTGLVKGSVPIMFFDEQGNYNVEAFLGELNKHVKKNEKFAIICNSGSRTQVVGGFLGNQMGYNVIDLEGGVQSAIQKKIPFVPYTLKR